VLSGTDRMRPWRRCPPYVPAAPSADAPVAPLHPWQVQPAGSADNHQYRTRHCQQREDQEGGSCKVSPLIEPAPCEGGEKEEKQVRKRRYGKGLGGPPAHPATAIS